MISAMKCCVNALTKFTHSATLAEARGVSRKKLKRVLFRNSERMKTVDTINLEVNWVEVEEFTILEVKEVTTVWAVQSSSCLKMKKRPNSFLSDT